MRNINTVIFQLATDVKTLRKENEANIDNIIVFKAVEKDATIGGGATVQRVDNDAKEKGVDASLEVRSIGGVAGHKRMRVIDLMSSLFDERVRTLQQILGARQKVDVACEEGVNTSNFMQADKKNDEKVVTVLGGVVEPVCEVEN